MSRISSSLGLRERKKIATRRNLLAAAESLFAEQQFEDVTIDQLAGLADVSQKTFFNYFPSKSHILRDLIVDWMASTQVWPEEMEPDLTCRSAIIPSNIDGILDWVVAHRRIMKMALRHTDFFDFIYFLDREDSNDEYRLVSTIRRPRLRRVEKAQQLGLIRRDISARAICNIYDSLRIEVVRRWLYLPDEKATGEELRAFYDVAVEVLISGIACTPELPEASAASPRS